MAKRVAVIDIGSNSVRMVIYERTSRFAFHLLYETKTKVRLSQNIYQNDGYLQKEPMQRTIQALSDFISIIESFKVRKILCVATSALRDAPNKQEFISRVKKEIQLHIKVIDGKRESYLGAIACANLLPEQQNGLSVDIGGGSTEFALINSKNVSNNISLNLGTVRLKELFFDNNDIDGAIEYCDEQLKFLDSLKINSLIGIGGTFRAISIAIMKKNNYALKKVHAYECKSEEFNKFLSKILNSKNNDDLKNINIKSNRFDIIKPGALILSRIMLKLSKVKIISSGVGVREGVYLTDLLRNSKDKLPINYNTSVRYILDNFVDDKNFSNQLNKLSKDIFDLTHVDMNLPSKYRNELAVAAKLYIAGSNINFYQQNRHSYQIIKSALEFGFSHQQSTLISTICKYVNKEKPSKRHMLKYSDLLPKESIVKQLIYMLSLSVAILNHKPRNIDFNLKYEDNELIIKSKKELYLSKEAISNLCKNKDFKVKIFVP